MLPRRTLSATSRTAKNPANSLVNPWVSRMNSSAKKFPPAGHARLAPPAFLKPSAPSGPVVRPPRTAASGGGICRHCTALGKAESLGNPTLARLAALAVSRSIATVCPARFTRSLRKRARPRPKASVNAVGTVGLRLHQKFSFPADVLPVCGNGDYRLGIRKHQTIGREVDQAT